METQFKYNESGERLYTIRNEEKEEQSINNEAQVTWTEL